MKSGKKLIPAFSLLDIRSKFEKGKKNSGKLLAEALS